MFFSYYFYYHWGEEYHSLYRGLCHKEVHYIKTAVAQVCKLEGSSYVGCVCRPFPSVFTPYYAPGIPVLETNTSKFKFHLESVSS